MIRLFYRSDPTFDLQRYRDQLGEYAYHSDKVTIEYIDADKEPFKAKQYEVQAYGTVVFEYDGRLERTTTTDEQGLTNALKKVIEGTAKKIYFAQGHGEHDPTASEADGYSGIEASLKSENFEVAKVTLAQEGKVPDDATVLVVAGPTDRLLSAGARRGARVSQARRQALADDRSARKAGGPGTDAAHRAREGMGLQRRQRHRRRRERPGQAAHGHGCIGPARHPRCRTRSPKGSGS